VIFVETRLAGAWLIELERREDDRGWFARSFCTEELRARGLNDRVVQANASFNRRRGTLRGMHYQRAPHGETKIVRVTRGRVHDVIVDVRPESPSFRQWFGVDLDERTGTALYVPEGVAHGFLTLADESEVHYLMGVAYVPEAAAGFRHDDPAFGIRWPETPRLVSERDLAFPPYSP
jgi:dTDP-4-dehydrorhamnose 3,5-epimerase